MRFVPQGSRNLLPLGALFVLAACGGGGGDSAPPATPAPAPVANCLLSTTDRSVVVSAGEARGLIDAPGIGQVDLREQRSLAVGSVRVDLGTSAEVEAAGRETQSFLGYRLADARVVSIALPSRPAEPGVPVALALQACPAAAGGGFLKLLAYAATDRYDGVPSMTAVSTTQDLGAARVTATVPASAFEAVGDAFVARLMLGTTSFSDGVASAGAGSLGTASTLAATPAAALLARVPCPLADGCTEISLFNPARRMPVAVPDQPLRSLRAGQHLGVDFRASEGTAVFARPGLVVVGGRTEALHREMLATPGDNFAKHGSGIHLVLQDELTFDRFRYLHLGSLEPWAVDPADPRRVALGARVPAVAGQALTRIGTTGRSGLATLSAPGSGAGEAAVEVVASPRLHFEMAAAGTVQHCKRSASATTPSCVAFPAHVDPMHHMVDRFEVVAAVPGPYPLDGSALLRVQAFDRLGQPIASQVEHVLEALPGHASRKFCLRDVLAGRAASVRLPAVGSRLSASQPHVPVRSEDGAWWCVDWRGTVPVEFLSSGMVALEATWTLSAEVPRPGITPTPSEPSLPRVATEDRRASFGAEVQPLGPLASVLPWLPTLGGLTSFERMASCSQLSPIADSGADPGRFFGYRVSAYAFAAPGADCRYPGVPGSAHAPSISFTLGDLTGFTHATTPAGPLSGVATAATFGRRGAMGVDYARVVYGVTAGNRYLDVSFGTNGAAQSNGVFESLRDDMPWSYLGPEPPPPPPPPTADYQGLMRTWVQSLHGSECRDANAAPWRAAYVPDPLDPARDRFRLRQVNLEPEQVAEWFVQELLQGASTLSYSGWRSGSTPFLADAPWPVYGKLESFGAPLREMFLTADGNTNRSQLRATFEFPVPGIGGAAQQVVCDR